jgi:hypothetical protein
MLIQAIIFYRIIDKHLFFSVADHDPFVTVEVQIRILLSSSKNSKKTLIPTVSDPFSFDPDPDPAFEAGDQSGSGSRDLMTKN